MNWLKSVIPPLLPALSCEIIPKRTTVVLKRKFPMRLHKVNQSPKTFRSKDFVYEVIKYNEKLENINVILTSYVEGLGQPGDQVSVRPISGYEKLIVTGLAVYATPENIAKYAGFEFDSKGATYSSKYSTKTLKLLRHRVVSVTMNDTQPWTLQPWHMRAAFRNNGFIVPEASIEMPKREISGPHVEQHRKEFYVTVTISETEHVKVRCRIHLVGIKTDPVPRLDWIDPAEPLFEEDREVLNSMPQTSELPYIDKIRMHLCG